MSNTIGSSAGLIKRALFATGADSSKEKVDSTKTLEEAKLLHATFDDNYDDVESRKKAAQNFVDKFYNLVTDFYETGWGQSFHFATRGPNETFRESIKRHEHYLALKLNIKQTDKVLDLGCGIGGPMRNICQFTGAHITGVTINDYQVRRGNAINKSVGLGNTCIIKQGDFTKLKDFNDNSFDKIFAIEATCHSPNRVDVFEQAYRVLKPGGLFATYEWLLKSDKYDKNDKKHREIKYLIEKGNALPDLINEKQCMKAFKQVGFEVVDEIDLDILSRNMNKQNKPWHFSLKAGLSIENIHHSYVGTLITHYICYFSEKIGLAPKGTFSTHELLLQAKNGLVMGGDTQIFTPMYLVVGRKPLNQ